MGSHFYAVPVTSSPIAGEARASSNGKCSQQNVVADIGTQDSETGWTGRGMLYHL